MREKVIIIMNKKLLLVVALLAGIIGFGACSSVSTNTVSTGNNGSIAIVVNKPSNATVENVNIKPANSTADTKPMNTTVDTKSPTKNDETAKSNAPTGGKIGVPECDEYIEKYEACLNSKVPEVQRAALLPQLEIYRKGWKNAATNPQAKAALAGGCKVALATAKQSMSDFSCDW